jgi:iron complex outermembrane receptor protein
MYSGRASFVRSYLSPVILLVGSLQAVAQSGQVSGTIKDPDQSVVAGAIVTLSNAHTATPLQTRTNAAGQYTFSSVAS